MKKTAIAVLMMLGMAAIGKTQTCSVQLASAGPPNKITLVDQWSGTAVIPGGFTISGSGRGKQNITPGIENGFAFESVAAGDFTLLGPLMALAGGTVPAGGFEVDYNAGGAYVKFTLYVENVGGVLTAYFDKGRFMSPNYVWTHIGSQGIGNLTNFGFKLVRSGNNLTGSITTDGTNYLALGTFAGTAAGTAKVEIFADSGDLTNLTTAVFNSFTVNGVTPSLTYSSNAGPVGSLESGAIQPGTLTLGPDTASGAVVYSFVGSGCDPAAKAALQTRIDNSTYSLVYSINVISNGVNIHSVNWLSTNVCVTCSASATSIANNVTLVHGTTYAMTKNVHVRFVDGAGAWTGADPILETITLTP